MVSWQDRRDLSNHAAQAAIVVPVITYPSRLRLYSPEAYRLSYNSIIAGMVCTIGLLVYRDWTLIQDALRQVAIIQLVLSK
jgi:hypothetical protein